MPVVMDGKWKEQARHLPSSAQISLYTYIKIKHEKLKLFLETSPIIFNYVRWPVTILLNGVNLSL
jgi:hypothetical protein